MKKRIFLIDDNMRSLDNAVQALESIYTVDKCQSNIKAKRLLTAVHYDLLIIDVMMPTMGLSNDDEFRAGYNLFFEFAQDRQKGVPVIFWTNASEESFQGVKQKFSNIDNVHFLQKSDDDNELLKIVNQILK